MKPNISPDMFDEKQPPMEKVVVEAPKIQVMFEVENVDYHVPRLCIQTGLQMDLYDISTRVSSNSV